MVWRKIPHPNYHKYGGAKNRCKGSNAECPLPVDPADFAFREHDLALRSIDALKDLSFWEKVKLKYQADKELSQALWKVKMKTLEPQKFPGYSTLYVAASRVLFWRP